jgi:PIN domain nuclease of toxin-antitoxin system
LLAKLNQPALFAEVLRAVQAHPAYRLEPLALSDIEALATLVSIPEMHDRLIAAVAQRLGATLLTKDAALHGAAGLTCVW